MTTETKRKRGRPRKGNGVVETYQAIRIPPDLFMVIHGVAEVLNVSLTDATTHVLVSGGCTPDEQPADVAARCLSAWQKSLEANHGA